MKNLHHDFLRAVEAYLTDTGMNATDLGKHAVGDTGFMTRLRAGRSPSLKTADRVLDWMEANPKGLKCTSSP